MHIEEPGMMNQNHYMLRKQKRIIIHNRKYVRHAVITHTQVNPKCKKFRSESLMSS